MEDFTRCTLSPPRPSSRCCFSMMVELANDGILQADDGKMLVTDGEMLLMMVK